MPTRSYLRPGERAQNRPPRGGGRGGVWRGRVARARVRRKDRVSSRRTLGGRARPPSRARRTGASAAAASPPRATAARGSVSCSCSCHA
eukprot:4701357-Prymnesium_polylepis.1